MYKSLKEQITKEVLYENIIKTLNHNLLLNQSNLKINLNQLGLKDKNINSIKIELSYNNQPIILDNTNYNIYCGLTNIIYGEFMQNNNLLISDVIIPLKFLYEHDIIIEIDHIFENNIDINITYSEVIFSSEFEKVLQSTIIDQLIEKEYKHKNIIEKRMNLFRIMRGMGGNCFAEYLPEERFKQFLTNNI